MRMLGFLIVLIALADSAQARPDLRTMSCGQANALVRQYGALVMTTGQYTYQRFVAAQRFCYYPEIIRRAWAATADTNQCFVGYTCELPVFRRFPFGRRDD